ncbi:unnamed protein product [Caenorhabditis brenneri]
MQKIILIILLYLQVLYGVSPDNPRNSGKLQKPKTTNTYAVETVENSVADNITEISGNSQEVEVIEGNYSGNETKTRTARRYYGRGGWGRGYGGRRWGGYGRRYYSYYSPRRRYYYYGGYYGRYYGGYYGYGSSLYNLCYNWVWGCSVSNYYYYAKA